MNHQFLHHLEGEHNAMHGHSFRSKHLHGPSCYQPYQMQGGELLQVLPIHKHYLQLLDTSYLCPLYCFRIHRIQHLHSQKKLRNQDLYELQFLRSLHLPSYRPQELEHHLRHKRMARKYHVTKIRYLLLQMQMQPKQQLQ